MGIGFYQGSVSDSAVAFPLRVTAPPALTPPAPLSPRERGEKDPRELLFYSLLSPGERRGRGGEGRRRGNAENEGNDGIGDRNSRRRMRLRICTHATKYPPPGPASAPVGRRGLRCRRQGAGRAAEPRRRGAGMERRPADGGHPARRPARRLWLRGARQQPAARRSARLGGALRR